MKSFDYMEFNDGYGLIFCAKKYIKEHLKEQKEFNDWDNEPKLRK